MNAAALPRSGGGQSKLADCCYIGLKLTGWLAVTGCCVVACWVGVFLLLGEFDFGRTVLHLDNFAARYLAADTARRADFEQGFWLSSAATFALVGFFRRHGLPAFRFNGKEEGDG